MSNKQFGKAVVYIVLTFLLVGITLITIYWLFLKKQTTTPSIKTIDSVSLGLSWVYESQFAGEFFADQKGLYRNNGLNVRLIPYDSKLNTDLVEKLLNKEYDFAILQGDALLKARSEGKPIVGIFVTYRKSPTVYFSKSESKIETLSDFVGKKIGVAYSEQIPLLTMLKSANIDPARVTIIDRQYTYEPLLNNEYDIEGGWVTDRDSLVSIGIQNPNEIKASDYNANIFADIITTTEETVKNKPDMVSRFVQATIEGWNSVAESPDESALLTLKYDPNTNPEHLKFVVKVSLPLIIPTKGSLPGDSSFVEWKRMYEMLKDQKIITKDFDVTTAYTNQFIK